MVSKRDIKITRLTMELKKLKRELRSELIKNGEDDDEASDFIDRAW